MASPLPFGQNSKSEHPNACVNAKELLELGFSIFAVKRRDKEPAVRSWKPYCERFPTEKEIAKWFSDTGTGIGNNFNVGIVTGKRSGVFILDADDSAAIEEIEKLGIPKTLECKTGRGKHYYFKYPGWHVPNVVGILNKCDIKGDSGYVVGPGSVHPTGSVYAWVSDPTTTPIADAPEWLLKLILLKSQRKGRAPDAHQASSQNRAPSPGRALSRVLNDLLDEIVEAPNGTRNTALNRIAFAFGQCVGFGSLSRQTAEDMLKDAALSTGLERDEIERTIRSGLDSGIASPRDLLKASNQKSSQASQLLSILNEIALFVSPDGRIHADIWVRGHRETHRIYSTAFRNILIHKYYKAFGLAPSSQAIDSGLALLDAKARDEDHCHDVQTRVGNYRGKIYIDLCNSEWQAIEVSTEGWQIVSNPPVRFRRTAGMLPLPRPSREASIEPLRTLLNVKTDADFVLTICWLLAALRKHRPYPVLVLTGEQGSAKSSFTRLLRDLVDPAKPPLQNLPKDDHELFISASNSYLIALDNVSHLNPDMSDALCRLATGGGFRTRKLYTDDEETLIEASSPIILNGIVDFASRADLADRSVFITLEPIPASDRLTESDVREFFELNNSRILGSLLNAMVRGLRSQSDVDLSEVPRMADFAMWAASCETEFFPKGTFIAAYTKNREAGAVCVIESDVVATAICAFMHKQTVWTGTASDLLEELRLLTTPQAASSRVFPYTPRKLSGHLRRILPSLRSEGFGVEFHKEGRDRTRLITISKTTTDKEPESPSAPSAPAAPRGNATDESRASRIRQELTIWRKING